jgi:hypothetical protein
MDPSEPGRDADDRLHEVVHVLGVDQDRDGADADELGVEEGLALHHRHAGHGPDVTEPQDAGAVGADRHAAPDHREAAGQLRELGQGLAHPRHTRGVDVADVLVGADLPPRGDLELAAVMSDEGAVVKPHHMDPGQGAQPGGQGLGMLLVAQLDRDLAQRLVARDGDRRHVTDQAAELRDACRDLRQLPGMMRDPQAIGAVHGHALTP